MASLQLQHSSLLSHSFCSSSKRVNAAIHVPKLLSRTPISYPQLPSRKLFEELNGFTHTKPMLQQEGSRISSTTSNSKAIITQQLYAILEAVADRIEMHHNIGQQRDNWNTLLLNSINMITLTASTMAGAAATFSGGAGAPLLALKLSSTLLFTAATGMLLLMNKIQPSQLAEEQRNATRLFKQLRTQIETLIAIGNPTEEDVKGSMQKVLALDKAFPLPLLGAMIEKFPKKFEPAVWWPSRKDKSKTQCHETKSNGGKNGWNKELERELREVLEVVKGKDMEDYERLGNLVLNINKTLAIAGPLLTGIAGVGSVFVSQGSWVAMVPVMTGALATALNAFQHGGQMGMVSEMYRNCAGFFQLLENTVQEAIEEEEEIRENGELFEMKLALKLGRSLSQLRDLAKKSAYSRVEGTAVDEFASKLF